MSFNDIDLSLTYSYAHYLNWLFDDRVELIAGKVFKMSPDPSRIHQEISVHLSSKLFNYLEAGPCKVYTAPFDVRFPDKSVADKDIFTVLQPDICVICDMSKLDDKGCIGAPDIVIEILSPGSNKIELVNKYRVYERHGVKEYWIVDPWKKMFLRYNPGSGGTYGTSKMFTIPESVNSDVLPGFLLDLKGLFPGS